ncbi:MAG: hypothetical protein PHT51_02905 [Patescibacteria group bacterium]|nr:hypothetical protein [Patescibacteria group bacterium]MDD4610799.1 hypothetical protein [Patescibacteria group bacterium]
MEINISPLLAKNILRINFLTRIKIMCRGYSEDKKNFTELVWPDDKDLDFYNKKDYPQFQLWFI